MAQPDFVRWKVCFVLGTIHFGNSYYRQHCPNTATQECRTFTSRGSGTNVNLAITCAIPAPRGDVNKRPHKGEP